MKKRVVVAMSGGVDSSVAAHLLVKDGYDVIGLFMRMGNLARMSGEHAASHGCCSYADSCDARSVAESIGIPFYTLNFEKEFAKIIDYFCGEYTSGRTPNPCIICNQRLKFGRLMDFAAALDADFVATGHYAVMDNDGKQRILKRGVDNRKDQSYVLAQLNREQLSRVMFPLGSITKEEVRGIADALGLKVKDKPESQEICFVPENNYKRFIADRIGAQVKSGDILDMDGNIVGRHDGIQFYTIGQRRGLNIAMGKPMYVVKIDRGGNAITIGQYDDLLAMELSASALNWIAIAPPEDPVKIFAKIRYNHKAASATLFTVDNSAKVVFDEPQRSVTPGQAVVFYDGKNDDIVLGSGWITG